MLVPLYFFLPSGLTWSCVAGQVELVLASGMLLDLLLGLQRHVPIVRLLKRDLVVEVIG